MATDTRITFRTTDVNKTRFQECAKSRNKSLSQWIVDVLCEEARQEELRGDRKTIQDVFDMLRD